jgi:hypothetical protein
MKLVDDRRIPADKYDRPDAGGCNAGYALFRHLRKVRSMPGVTILRMPNLKDDRIPAGIGRLSSPTAGGSMPPYTDYYMATADLRQVSI